VLVIGGNVKHEVRDKDRCTGPKWLSTERFSLGASYIKCGHSDPRDFLLVHRPRKHGVRGCQLKRSLTFSSRGQRILFHSSLLTCTKHVFFRRLNHCHAPSTYAIHSARSAHIKIMLSLAYRSLAEHSSFREPFVAKSLDQNCTLFGIKTKCNFVSKCPIVHMKFAKFPGVIPESLLRKGATPPAPT